MAEDQSFRELLAFVDAALAPDSDVDVADAELRLQKAMPDFLNLLQQKVGPRRMPLNTCWRHAQGCNKRHRLNLF